MREAQHVPQPRIVTPQRKTLEGEVARALRVVHVECQARPRDTRVDVLGRIGQRAIEFRGGAHIVADFAREHSREIAARHERRRARQQPVVAFPRR